MDIALVVCGPCIPTLHVCCGSLWAGIVSWARGRKGRELFLCSFWGLGASTALGCARTWEGAVVSAAGGGGSSLASS